jgi:hypothetical protein
MKSVIDTIFNPVIAWLTSIYQAIHELSVPLARPINISQYLGPFAYLGPYWITFITTVCVFAFIYVVCFLIVAQKGMIIKFKDMVKWW